MSKLYKVTFNINQIYGYIAFDETNKDITIVYPDQTIASKIKNWLSTEHDINMPTENGSVSDFSTRTYLATNSLQDLQTVLTRAWESLDVHIDWSFPPDSI